MHINKTHLKNIDRAAHTLRLISETLVYNIKYNRVSHTVGLLRRLYKTTAQIQSQTTFDVDFIHRLERVLLSAQHGPTELHFDDTNVYISGSFKIAELKQMISVSDLNATVLISHNGEED